MKADAMRVLMVDSERTWRGGQRQLLLLLRGLREEGIETALAAPAQSAMGEQARALGVDVRALAFRGAGALRAPARLRAMALDGGFNIVHAHASRAHGVMAAAWAGRAGRPLRVVSRRAAAGRRSRIAGALKYRRGADLYLAVSRAVGEDLVGAGLDAARVRVVADGVDLAALRALGDGKQARAELGIEDDAPIVGQVAALTPEKAQADLLHAAREVCRARPRARFVIVGDGALRGALETMARRLGIDAHVTFTGFRDDAVALLSAFDCFAISSRREGLCSSIMDAHALGVPVVATRAGGIPELVADGESGLLVPAADPAALATAIGRILDDGGLRARCVAGGRAAAAGYDYRRMVYKTLDAYRSMLRAGVASIPPEKGDTNR